MAQPRTETITIQGHPFRVPVRYAEGHTLKANEASALNQTFHENLRNNFASKVKDGLEANVGVDVLQSQLDAYAQEYEFGLRTGGGRSADPVQSEAIAIARDRVRAAIKTKGRTLSDYSAEQITTMARKLLETQGPDGNIMQTARQRVEAEREAAQSAVAELSEIIDEVPQEQEAQVQEAAPPAPEPAPAHHQQHPQHGGHTATAA